MIRYKVNPLITTVIKVFIQKKLFLDNIHKEKYLNGFKSGTIFYYKSSNLSSSSILVQITEIARKKFKLIKKNNIFDSTKFYY